MSRAKPLPFLFDCDFGARPEPAAALPDEDVAARHAAEIAQAEARGFERGRQAGFSAAGDSDNARLAASLERIGTLLLGETVRENSRLEDRRAAVDLAQAFAGRLAGRALARFPLADIEYAAICCFAEAATAPHLAVRVHEAFVEAVQIRLRQLASEKGFAGKLVVLGDPEIAPGDARVEWADGGIVRDRAAVSRAIDQAVETYLATAEGPTAKEPI